MPLLEYTGALDRKGIAHLLRRATFGPTKAQIDAYVDDNLTPAEALDLLFPQTLPDPLPPIDPLTGVAWGTVNAIDPVTGQGQVTLPAGEEDDDYQEYFKGWFIAQMMSAGIDPDLSLAYAAREKIVLFLHTHFTAIQSKISNSCSLYFQNQLFRLFSRDGITSTPEINFKELTVKVSVDNAMLRLLDGDLNVEGSPNENYARELLELYSIGRGLEGDPALGTSTGEGDYILYTEEDVQAAARVLSGWEVDEDFTTMDTDTGLPRGRVRGGATNASAHDNDPKQFSARMNNAVIQGDPLLMPGGVPTEESALDEIRQLIDLIYSNHATAKNICWKIYRFFVYAPHTPETSLVVDATIITEMAKTLEAQNYKILPVIIELLKSQHFYDAVTDNDPTSVEDMTDDNFGGIIKSPIDLTLGMYRFFGIQLPDMATQTEAFYETTASIIQELDGQGMRYYEPYDVAGYDAYHQYPIYHRSWITPNYLANRYDFARKVLVYGMDNALTVDLLTFVTDNFTPAVASDANELVKELAQYILPVSDNLTFEDATPNDDSDDKATLTVIRLNYFKQRFLQNLGGGSQSPEDYWTSRWGGTDKDELRRHLESLFNAMMQSPEYQLA
jgi:uncharacterized protein (DUF1800 family)